MSTVKTAVDRRRNRSDQATEAIHFQLRHLAEQYDLNHLVLADSRGLMLASANGEAKEAAASALAAYAPVFARHLDRGARDQVMQKLGDELPEVTGSTLSVRRFTLHGEDHFLCVVGEEPMIRQANLYRAVSGIRRIVRETSSDAA